MPQDTAPQDEKNTNPEVVKDQAPTEIPQTEPSEPKPKKSKKFIALVVILVVLVLSGGGAFALYKMSGNDKAPASATPKASPTSAISEATPAPSDYVWLEAPKPIASLKLFTNLDKYWQQETLAEADKIKESTIHYYEVGHVKANEANKLVLVTLPSMGPGESSYALFMQDGQSYMLLKNHSPNLLDYPARKNYNGPDLASNVTIDSTTSIAELALPTELTYKNTKLVTIQTVTADIPLYPSLQVDSEDTLLAAPAKGSLVATYPTGKLYKVLGKISDDFSTEYYVLKSPDFQSVKYRGDLALKIPLDNIPAITYTDKTKNSDAFSGAVVGCSQSAGSNGIATKATADSVEQVGTANDNVAVYQLKSLDDALFTKIYKDYTDLIAPDVPISKQEFQNKHGYFLTQDGFGQYVLFLNTKYISGGGCAKPVVYLYPTKTTKVSVKIGAKVTISDPQYNTGWQVTAQPNGKLTDAGGKTYGSLFWEGYGNGVYPDINQGVIVSTSNAVTTIKQQLKQLNLNDQEIADFLAFWADKLPTAPYVRLTWLSTRQMQQLAPLNISPAPDSMIRVFLDFEGLDKPYPIKSQNLVSAPRSGFTVVEWGGLLRQGLPKN